MEKKNDSLLDERSLGIEEIQGQVAARGLGSQDVEKSERAISSLIVAQSFARSRDFGKAEAALGIAVDRIRGIVDSGTQMMLAKKVRRMSEDIRHDRDSAATIFDVDLDDRTSAGTGHLESLPSRQEERIVRLQQMITDARRGRKMATAFYAVKTLENLALIDEATERRQAMLLYNRAVAYADRTKGVMAIHRDLLGELYGVYERIQACWPEHTKPVHSADYDIERGATAAAAIVEKQVAQFEDMSEGSRPVVNRINGFRESPRWYAPNGGRMGQTPDAAEAQEVQRDAAVASGGIDWMRVTKGAAAVGALVGVFWLLGRKDESEEEEE